MVTCYRINQLLLHHSMGSNIIFARLRGWLTFSPRKTSHLPFSILLTMEASFFCIALDIECAAENVIKRVRRLFLMGMSRVTHIGSQKHSNPQNKLLIVLEDLQKKIERKSGSLDCIEHPNVNSRDVKPGFLTKIKNVKKCKILLIFFFR